MSSIFYLLQLFQTVKKSFFIGLGKTQQENVETNSNKY